MIHGGDVQFFKIDELPQTGVNVDPYILARGEKSGHCHIVTGDVKHYKDGNDMIIVVGPNGAFHQHTMEASLTAEDWKRNENFADADHTKACPIPPGTYKVAIHLQYNPWEKVMEETYD